MTQSTEMPSAEDIRRCLDEDSLREWISRQRWYASKSRQLASIEIVEGVTLHEDPMLFLALVQTRFATGTHELYQLPLAVQAAGAGAPGGIASAGNWTAFDAVAEPDRLLELIRRMGTGAATDGTAGSFSFHLAEGAEPLPEPGHARTMGVEQSNTSIVVDGALALKVFRKLEPGVNPELELLRFLTARQFPHIASLYGSYDYDGQALTATLGVAQQFVTGAIDGWELALERLPEQADWLLEQLERLGTVTAAMHNVLASDASDPAFAPEEPSQEALSLLTATVDEDIERIFLRLPDDGAVAEIIGRGQDVRERLAARSQVGVGGRVIRTHGDYHLGQTLLSADRWVIIDFEGEPARPLPERRAKRSPLRDVAGILRSFAYVTSAVELQRGRQAPAGFEAAARERFLAAYLATVDHTLLPPGQSAAANLLSVFELEKAIYELRYELDHRPDWVGIPVAGIRRLLESDA